MSVFDFSTGIPYGLLGQRLSHQSTPRFPSQEGWVPVLVHYRMWILENGRAAWRMPMNNQGTCPAGP